MTKEGSPLVIVNDGADVSDADAGQSLGHAPVESHEENVGPHISNGPGGGVIIDKLCLFFCFTPQQSTGSLLKTCVSKLWDSGECGGPLSATCVIQLQYKIHHKLNVGLVHHASPAVTGAR